MVSESYSACRVLSAKYLSSKDGQASTDGIQKALGQFLSGESTLALYLTEYQK